MYLLHSSTRPQDITNPVSSFNSLHSVRSRSLILLCDILIDSITVGLCPFFRADFSVLVSFVAARFNDIASSRDSASSCEPQAKNRRLSPVMKLIVRTNHTYQARPIHRQDLNSWENCSKMAVMIIQRRVWPMRKNKACINRMRNTLQTVYAHTILKRSHRHTMPMIQSQQLFQTDLGRL